MKISQRGIDFIKKEEGCVLKVYLDVVGVKTLGYGHTGPEVNAMAVGTPITREVADAYLLSDLHKFELNVMKYDPIFHWSQNEIDSLVSFAFNVGSIDQLTAKGTRTKQEIADKMLEYNKAAKKVIPALTRRRKAERDMFLGDSDNNLQIVIGKTYTTTSNLYIRQEPYGEKMKFECITMNAKAHSRFDDYGCAILQKDTRVTCLDIKELTDSTWILVKSGWICAKEREKTYIK